MNFYPFSLVPIILYVLHQDTIYDHLVEFSCERIEASKNRITFSTHLQMYSKTLTFHHNEQKPLQKSVPSSLSHWHFIYNNQNAPNNIFHFYQSTPSHTHKTSIFSATNESHKTHTYPTQNPMKHMCSINKPLPTNQSSREFESPSKSKWVLHSLE